MEALRLDLERLNGTQGDSSLSPAQLQVKRMQERMADRARRSKNDAPAEPGAEPDGEWVCEICCRVHPPGQQKVCSYCHQPKRGAWGSPGDRVEGVPVYDEASSGGNVWRTAPTEKSGEQPRLTGGASSGWAQHCCFIFPPDPAPPLQPLLGLRQAPGSAGACGPQTSAGSRIVTWRCVPKSTPGRRSSASLASHVKGAQPVLLVMCLPGCRGSIRLAEP